VSLASLPLPELAQPAGADLVEVADARIRRALRWADAPAVTCSMQRGGLVLVHLLRRRLADIPVLFVDTGYHFEETIELRDRLAAEWRLNLVVLSAGDTVAQHESARGLLYETDAAACCALRKVAPVERALANHDVWFTSLRNDQAASRAAVHPLEVHRLSTGSSIMKVNPIVEWTWGDVDRYADANGVPSHRLYRAGYTSIGCWPCTRRTFGSGDDRSGRWGGEDGTTECGLHITLSTPTDPRVS